MSAELELAKKAWTEAEVEALPDDGYSHEIVNGELVMSPKNNWYHGRICTRLLFALESFNRAHRLGAVLDSSTGFWMQNRNCRAPDVSFVSKARLEHAGFRPRATQFFPGAPDLAVEILSPGNTRAEIDARLRDFFASGTQLSWIVNPEERTLAVSRWAPEGYLEVLLAQAGERVNAEPFDLVELDVATLFEDAEGE